MQLVVLGYVDQLLDYGVVRLGVLLLHQHICARKNVAVDATMYQVELVEELRRNEEGPVAVDPAGFAEPLDASVRCNHDDPVRFALVVEAHEWRPRSGRRELEVPASVEGNVACSLGKSLWSCSYGYSACWKANRTLGNTWRFALFQILREKVYF